MARWVRERKEAGITETKTSTDGEEVGVIQGEILCTPTD